ncbi:hypothetical protein GJ699_22895 [Duganella sp. FT80W]|uniref:Uncharacterized protein n=1 Tax=Duganella guangzhouensis TaxID=2666084 RepID=A0A6I2L3Y6_9BURK|nr:hypothetical protein [Duganella guangzhouensis]MRW92851.1 hypothetical protein [Duganella guangzhouensis]
MVKPPTPEKYPRWRIVRFAAFAVMVVLFIFVASKAGIMGAGVIMLIDAGLHIAECRIPYGWEGKEPSGYLTGLPALLVSLLTGVLGITMIILPELMLTLVGWSDA